MRFSEKDLVEFDGFRLDPRSRTLERGGTPVKLAPKAVETLIVLIRACPEVVGRDELRQALWPDSVVEDSNLTQYIHVLRKTLGSTPDGRPYIETLSKRGYRFTGEPRLLEAPPQPDSETVAPAPPATPPPLPAVRPSRLWLAGVGVLALVAIAAVVSRPNVTAYRPHPEALRLYEKGRALLRQRKLTADDAEQAFREAIAIDPKFLPAQVGLADSLAVGPYPAREARELIEKILAEHDDYAEAHATAGLIAMFHGWDWEAARRHLERSIALNPRYVWSRQWYALWNTLRGRHREAEEQLQTAAAIEPASVNVLTAQCSAAYLRGNPTEAIRYCDEALAIDGRFVQAHRWLACVYSQMRNGEALQVHLKAFAVGLEPNKSTLQLFDDYRAAYRQGGIEALWRLRLAQLDQGYDAAIMHAWLGDRGGALDRLEEACGRHVFYVVYAGVEPAFLPLHGNPRFERLLQRIKLPSQAAPPASEVTQ
jgi:DNA-binding winged helix-turn-helix (wHTH) protein/tetratricopeptide (TPR) repeat protein